MDWLAHIEDFTGTLADTAAANDLTTPVPTCPAWTLADLTWHLLEVQDFCAWIISNRPAGPENYSQPARPADEELPTGLRSACASLLAALEAADPADVAWSWSANHTVGFTYRRQAHEAFVHLADGLIATGNSLPKATGPFGADGIDEIVANNLQPVPDWAEFTPSHDQLLSLHATDEDRTWTFQFGTFSGISPTSGTTYTDEPQVQLGQGEARAAARADAATLDLWLWGRAPTNALEIDGDAALINDLRTIAAGETQ